MTDSKADTYWRLLAVKEHKILRINLGDNFDEFSQAEEAELTDGDNYKNVRHGA